VIYFVQSIDGGPIKIGHTENLDVRLKQLQVHYARPLAVLATMAGDRAEEQAIHERFAHHRMGRMEQFRPDPEILDFIRRPLLRSPGPMTAEAMPASCRSVVVTGSPEWVAWLHRGARFLRADVAKMIDMATVEYARNRGFDDPPPRRVP
jgi:hypothetical protein